MVLDMLEVIGIVYFFFSLVLGVEVMRERAARPKWARPRWWIAGALIEGIAAMILWPLGVAERVFKATRPIIVIKKK